MANKNHSLYIYNAEGELACRVFFSDDETPDYDHPQWQRLVAGGVVIRVDPAVHAGKVDPHPQNFNGKAVHHDLDKRLLPDIRKLSPAHADALSARIDHRETAWAAQAQALADEKAKHKAFADSLNPAQAKKLSAIQTRQDMADFLKTLTPGQQKAAPFTLPVVA